MQLDPRGLLVDLDDPLDDGGAISRQRLPSFPQDFGGRVDPPTQCVALKLFFNAGCGGGRRLI